MRPVPSYLRGSPPPAEVYDVALLDLDGVVYVGPDAVDGAPQALAAARAAGMRLTFVTNNAARPPQDVAAHLTELGIPAAAAEIVTSAQAAARYLSDRLPAGAHVLVVGTTGLIEALRERGLTPVGDAQGDVDAVVQGYSPDLDWRLLAEGAIAINRGVPWVATNLDPTVPSPRGPLPGNGSLVAALRHATSVEPVATGKPDPTMHRESLLRSKAERPIVVGDRLDTDIEGANTVGCASLLVFSGVTTPRELLAAPPKLRPTYVAADLGGLLVDHPEPQRLDDGVVCGHWRAVHVGGRGGGPALGLQRLATSPSPAPELTARPALSDDDLDALRALCVAAWTEADQSSAGRPAAAPGVAPAPDHSSAGGDGAAGVIERLGLG